MTLNLEYRVKTSIPVEIEGLTPDWARDKSLADIERFEIFHGNQKLPLAEMFHITGDPGDERFEFTGDLSGVHWVGTKMVSGEIHIRGSAGRHVGSEMSGGKIVVEENVSGWLGAEMHGGVIHVRGNADHLVGAAYRGSTKGMTGGIVMVDGNAGNEIGLSMRRGLIAIRGSAGNMLGFNLIAGTILVLGECGTRPGAGMRRGTLGLFGQNPPALLPGFCYATTFRPQFISVILCSLRDQGFHIDESLFHSEFDLFHGDKVALGRGEILFRKS